MGGKGGGIWARNQGRRLHRHQVLAGKDTPKAKARGPAPGPLLQGGVRQLGRAWSVCAAHLHSRLGLLQDGRQQHEVVVLHTERTQRTKRTHEGGVGSLQQARRRGSGWATHAAHPSPAHSCSPQTEPAVHRAPAVPGGLLPALGTLDARPVAPRAHTPNASRPTEVPMGRTAGHPRPRRLVALWLLEPTCTQTMSPSW